MSTELKVYRLAVCLYPNVTPLDYQGAMELLGGFSTDNQARWGHLYKNRPPCAINPEYLSHTPEPVKPMVGPGLVPSMTYKEALELEDGKDFDIILVPGGPNSDPNKGPKAKHILTVCTGSWVLAGTGLLNGKRATTNKASYRMIVEKTKDFNITWVPKARWVVNDDKHIWTASGVTAGMDLALSFLTFFTNEAFAEEARGIIELSAHKDPNEDEFASFYGLV
uniref:Putative class I glutamine amidotransferase-like protein n=1 Tax=Moniliophthora roreri TaxID=221103 RepID=A0A0W0F2K8_MONRR